MVSTTQVGGGGKTPNNSSTAKKNQSKPNNKKQVGFKGDANAESVLHWKVITSGANQSRQIIAIVAALPRFIGDNCFPHWAESIRIMQRKTQDDFMLADVGRSAHGTVTQAGVFVWNGNTIETEDNYNRAMEVWDRCVTSVIKNRDNYKNNGEYIFLAIQGQVEPSLWYKTKDDPRFAAIQTLKCPIELINFMKERCTGAAAGV